MDKIEQRFWGKVRKSGSCWEWLASLGDGYGWFSIKSRMVRAHRVSWELAYGAIPADMHVLHRCDNRKCVRPEHLFLGTNSDNIADRMSKGRKSGVAGERNGRAKLSAAAVVAIKSQLSAGISQSAIAREYGVCQQSISCIAQGQHWNAVQSRVS